MTQTRRRFIRTLGGVGLSLSFGASAAINWEGKLRLLNGPMLGWTSPDRATVWVRVAGEHEVRLATTPEGGSTEYGPPQRALAENDYCAVLESARLAPGTRYRYRVLFGDTEADYMNEQPPAYLRSAPAGPAEFSIAFGSCARFQVDPVQPIWDGVRNAAPDLFFWLGDNVYIDSVDPVVMSTTYQQQRDVVKAQPVLRNIPQLALWDDHDFCLNDHDRRNPGKVDALRAFKQYFANPSYGEADNPGVYFHYAYGGVDFFMLDVRYYRDPNDAPDGGDKTMLGHRQLEWLKQGLKDSDAPFKVLASGSGFSAAKGPTGDAWSSHMSERNALFDFIRDEGIGGVLLISGDTHVGELNCIPWSERDGYDYYELVSSPLAQPPEKGSWLERRPEIRLRPVYSRGNNVGMLEFDMTADDPTVTLTLRTIHGQSVFWDPLTLRASELVNGRSTWREHIDDVSLRRHESWQSGGPYYPPLDT